MPPIQPKPRFHPNHALLAACVAVLAMSVGASAFAVLHRRSEAERLTDLRARGLITVAPQFHDPLALPLPAFATVRRASPEDSAYSALATAGYVQLHHLSTRYYRRQRQPYFHIALELTDNGWTSATNWGRRDEQTYLVPLAYREITGLGLSPGSDPSTGAAEYWIRWRWQPTVIGAQLAPSLRDPWHISSETFGAHATLARSDAGWEVTSITIER